MAAALVSVPATAAPALELVPAGDDASVVSWTAAEIETARDLCEATDAGDARFLLGDWLLAKVPMGARGPKTGGHKRLADLGAHIDVSATFLLSLRSVAYAWPPHLRLAEAPWFVHRAYLHGGPSGAEHRRAQLLSLERDRWGRITTGIFERWRRAQMQDRGSPARPKRREAQLAARIDELAGEVDRVIRAGAPQELWRPIIDDLDRLASDVERVLAAVAA
jgi:hypothetical protein